MPKKRKIKVVVISEEMQAVASHIQLDIELFEIAIARATGKSERKDAEAQKDLLVESRRKVLQGSYKEAFRYLDKLGDERPKLENLKIGPLVYLISAVRTALGEQQDAKKGKT